MSVCDSVRISLAYLSVDCNPEHFTFKGYRLFTILLRVESDLVIDEQNPLVLQECSELIFGLAIRSILTSLELDIEQACVW